MLTNRSELRSAEDSIWDRLLVLVERFDRWQRLVKIALIVAAGTAAIGGAMDGSLVVTDPNLHVTLKGVLVISASVVGVLGGIALLRWDNDLPAIIGDVRSGLSDLRSHHDERDAMIANEAWRADCEVAADVMMNAIETVLLDRDRPLPDRVRAFLEAVHLSLLRAWGIEYDDWTISVFRWAPDQKRAVRLAERWRNGSAPSLDDRSWPGGEGYTGYAYQINRYVAEPDTAAARARNTYRVATEMEIGTNHPSGLRPDADLYRSIAATPVRVGNERSPWGIVTITSDAVDRFDYRDIRTRGGANEQLVKLAAAFVALIVASDGR